MEPTEVGRFLMVVSIIFSLASPQIYDPVDVNVPSVTLRAELNGHVTLETKRNGSVIMTPGGSGGTVYFRKIDMLKIIERVTSLPPFWLDYGPGGYLGEYRGGETVHLQIKAKDPDGNTVSYQLIAGALPPGINLNTFTGELHGVAPDADAMFPFTVRAVDFHGRYSDAVFKIVTRGSNACLARPCSNGGTCYQKPLDFRCSCLHPHGGRKCELDCSANPMGVDARTSVKKIHDAQMSAFGSYGIYFAKNGRLYGSGWYGQGSGSWLQVDFENTTHVFGVQMQGDSSSYYTSQYYLQYSLGGRHFTNYTNPMTGNVEFFSGYANTNVFTSHLKDVLTTRFLRFIPTKWNPSYRPLMKVEVLGCYVY